MQYPTHISISMITYQRISFDWNLIGDAMVSVLASNVVDCGFE